MVLVTDKNNKSHQSTKQFTNEWLNGFTVSKSLSLFNMKPKKIQKDFSLSWFQDSVVINSSKEWQIKDLQMKECKVPIRQCIPSEISLGQIQIKTDLIEKRKPISQIHFPTTTTSSPSSSHSQVRFSSADNRPLPVTEITASL